jgi:2'-5' RNA ligase
MHSIYLRFEGSQKLGLEKFRKEHDSLSEKIEAHVTVLFPNDCLVSSELIDAVDQLEPLERFNFTADDEITYDGDIGYLRIGKGSGSVTGIYGQLSEIFGIRSHYSYVPHITVVRNSNNRPSSIGCGSCEFSVTSVVIEKILANSSSKQIYEKKCKN